MSETVAILNRPHAHTGIGRIALAFAVLGACLVGMGLWFAEPLELRSASADVESASVEPRAYPPRELSAEWRWQPEPVRTEHMHPAQPSYRYRSSAGLDWIRSNGR